MELINYYNKSLRNVSGVYRIRNLSNNKFYIGSAHSLYNRFIQHKQALQYNKHHSQYLQRAFNKYGTNQFIMEILLICDSEYLLYYEQQLIYELCPEYNMNKLATSNKGYKWSQESRLKLSNSLKGNTCALGHVLTEESKVKISNSLKGKFDGEKNPFYGKNHSSESREKIRQSKLGTKHSSQTKEKMSKAKNQKIQIDGITYESQKEASKQLGISCSTISRRINSDKYTNYIKL